MPTKGVAVSNAASVLPRRWPSTLSISMPETLRDRLEEVAARESSAAGTIVRRAVMTELARLDRARRSRGDV